MENPPTALWSLAAIRSSSLVDSAYTLNCPSIVGMISFTSSLWKFLMRNIPSSDCLPGEFGSVLYHVGVTIIIGLILPSAIRLSTTLISSVFWSTSPNAVCWLSDMPCIR